MSENGDSGSDHFGGGMPGYMIKMTQMLCKVRGARMPDKLKTKLDVVLSQWHLLEHCGAHGVEKPMCFI
jgi:hypothetical protein